VFASSLVRRSLNEIAPPGQLNRSAFRVLTLPLQNPERRSKDVGKGDLEMKRRMSPNLLLLIFILILGSLIGQGQSDSTLVCHQKPVEVEKQFYNALTGKYEFRWVIEYRRECVPAENETSPGTSGGQTSHPNTVRNAEGKRTPANGYQWVNNDDPNDLRVKPKPGLIEAEPGKLRPANGYQWVNDTDPKDFRVEPKLGLVESEPGKLRPAKGYRWVNNDDPKDFRVERIPPTRRTNR
jgi:hypothetical protein